MEHTGTRDARDRAMTDETQSPQADTHTPEPASHRLAQFVRRHPGGSVLGAAAIGLLGGVEVAIGMLIGAGVLALARTQPGANSAHGVRERARSIIERAPGEVRAKARAVVQAAQSRFSKTEAASAQPNGVPESAHTREA